jgi:hypothetical protein
MLGGIALCVQSKRWYISAFLCITCTVMILHAQMSVRCLRIGYRRLRHVDAWLHHKASHAWRLLLKMQRYTVNSSHIETMNREKLVNFYIYARLFLSNYFVIIASWTHSLTRWSTNMSPSYHDAHTRLKAGTTPFLVNGACSRPTYATTPRIVSSVEGCSNMSV